MNDLKMILLMFLSILTLSFIVLFIRNVRKEIKKMIKEIYQMILGHIKDE